MSLNINGGTIINPDHIQFPNISSNPSSPSAGDVYYNTTDNKLKLYNGSAWVNVG